MTSRPIRTPPDAPLYGSEDFDFYSDGLRRPRPLILQHDEQDCGAAALAMVARAYGLKVTIQYCRSLLDIGSDGVSLYGIAVAASKLGLKTQAIQCELDQLEGLRTPMIAGYASHFVVVQSIDGGTISLADPGFGKVERDLTEFRSEWDGLLLLFNAPADLKEISFQTHPPFSTLREIFLESRRPLVLAFGLSIATSVLGIAAPIYAGKIFDRYGVESARSSLQFLVVALLGMKLLSLLLSGVRTLSLAHLETHIDTGLSGRIARKMLTLPIRSFRSRTVGDYMSRFSDASKMADFLCSTLLNGILDLSTTFIFFSVLLVLEWRLAVLGVGIGASIALASWFQNSAAKNRLYEIARLHSNVFTRFLELAGNTITIRVFNLERAFSERILSSVREANRQNLFLKNSRTRLHSFFEFVFLFGSIEILLVCADRIHLENRTLGGIVASAALLYQFISPVRGLANALFEIQSVLVSVDRLDDLMLADPESSGSERFSSDGPFEIGFEGVSFQYGNSDSPWALRDVSFAVKPGEVCAIVGESGSGKTTLLQLLPRIYTPNEGRIIFGNQDTQSVSVADLRERVSYISQDCRIFDGTIAFNISPSDSAVDEGRLVRAASTARVMDYVQSLSMGFKTVISENERSLSGGQKQRIGIARALYKDSEIMVLDEPTSALDGELESSMMSAILSAGKTIFISSHRLSVIRFCTKIIVLKEGRLCEQGSLDELVAKRGHFYDLFKSQLFGPVSKLT